MRLGVERSFVGSETAATGLYWVKLHDANPFTAGAHIWTIPHERAFSTGFYF